MIRCIFYSLFSAWLVAHMMSQSFADPADHRTNRIDPRIARIPDELQQRVFDDPEGQDARLSGESFVLAAAG